MVRTIFLFFSLTLVLGCAGNLEHKKDPQDTTELVKSVQDFHLKMRWGLWEQASAYTDEGFRQHFNGRYEELGEDYKITDLEVKKVTPEPEQTLVEVEQQWYHEPNMTVQKERIIEVWTQSEGVWRLKDRLLKEEWRERKQAKATAESSASLSDGTPSETPAKE